MRCQFVCDAVKKVVGAAGSSPTEMGAAEPKAAQQRTGEMTLTN